MRRSAARGIVLLACLVCGGLPTLRAAELRPSTVAAFDRYAELTEQRSSTSAPFLWVDAQPAAQQQTMVRTLQRGGLIMEPLVTRDGNQTIAVPDGMIHDWIGVVFVPDVTLERAVTLLQDYDRHHEIYKPNVAESRLLARDGDHFRVRLRFFMKRVVTVVVDSDHDAQFTREGPDRVSSRIRSTRIAEVENPGTSRERELPVGHDSGYLWRLNSYWRFLARDGGVFIQCESITLTRDIPTGLGWVVRPFVTSIPRETLTFTLETTRHALTTASR
jgi:hypothetical protein